MDWSKDTRKFRSVLIESIVNEFRRIANECTSELVDVAVVITEREGIIVALAMRGAMSVQTLICPGCFITRHADHDRAATAVIRALIAGLDATRVDPKEFSSCADDA